MEDTTRESALPIGKFTNAKKFIELNSFISLSRIPFSGSNFPPSVRAPHRLSNDFQVQWMKINNWKTQARGVIKRAMRWQRKKRVENRQYRAATTFFYIFYEAQTNSLRRLPSAYFSILIIFHLSVKCFAAKHSRFYWCRFSFLHRSGVRKEQARIKRLLSFSLLQCCGGGNKCRPSRGCCGEVETFCLLIINILIPRTC